MPSADSILSGLTTVANEWRSVAFLWHMFVVALLLPLLLGVRPSRRLVAGLLVLPVVSVSALAWISGNPFNGAMFAVLALRLMMVARALPTGPVLCRGEAGGRSHNIPSR